MPDNANLPLETDTAVIDEISLCVYQTILEMQQQQPELLKEKYRQVQWQNPRNQSMLMERLKEEISHPLDSKKQIHKLKKFLQLLLESSFFQSPQFNLLINKVQSLIQKKSSLSKGDSLGEEKSGTQESEKAIAVLLLDAENLHLDNETEKFLATICTYPIQIKVAFANWRSQGKKDLELHERHYELIHVPAGKDSADLKMSTVGSSIFVHYPTAKEVLVCSSDNALIHLCTTLQTHGLTVYRVNQQGNTIKVFNSKTGKNYTYSLKLLPEIPSIEEFLSQLKQMIKSELDSTDNRWIELSVLSNIFKAKYQLTISQVVSTHFPGKRARDIFIENSSDFVVHQPSEKSQLYISLFEIPKQKASNSNNAISQVEVKIQEQTSSKINSQADLEKALLHLLNTLTSKSPGSYISISILGTEFHKQYSQSISETLKRLQLAGNFPKFIQTCQSLKLEQIGTEWKVAIAL